MNNSLQLTIEPKIGLGNLLFGFSIDKVIDYLGPADYQEDIQDDDGFNSTMLAYDESDLNLFFDGASSILSDIEIENPETVLFNTKIFLLNQQQLLDLMKDNGYKDYDIDFDEELKENCVSYEDELLDFYFANEKLVSVNFGVLVATNGEIFND